MAGPGPLLFKASLKSWFGAKGFWMVVVAALVPLLLTGAWLVTHQRDLRAVDASWDVEDPIEGQSVNFTATVKNVGRTAAGAFNATLVVGPKVGASISGEASQNQHFDGLKAGQTGTVNLTWKARAGVFWVGLQADSGDSVGEIEEFNNLYARPFVVNYSQPRAAAGPTPPGNLTGNRSAGPRADLALTDLGWEPADLHALTNATFTITVTNNGPDRVENANVTLHVGQAFGNRIFPSAQSLGNISLDPGQSSPVTLAWRAQAGAYWAEAYVNTSAAARDANAGDNYANRSFVVNPQLDPKDTPPEQATKKETITDFYLQVLSLLHLRLLIPFIGLWYAAGALTDDRERGNLPYLLTRPINRAVLPLTRFLAGFLVAAAALVLGLLATFGLLFGTPQGNLGLLTTPLLASLLALFAYGGFFTFLGVMTNRPYILGVAFVLGWETVAPRFVTWVDGLTISHYVLRSIIGTPEDPLDGWRLDQGLEWLPHGSQALGALRILLLVGVGFLVAASWAIRRREFDV